MGHLGRAVVERDEALLGEPVQERLDRSGVGALRHELADGHAPARVLAALAELRHADQHAADQPALLVGQRVDQRVGGAADGRGDTAGLAVALDGERAAVAALPGGAQRVREQRQGTGLGGDVAQDQLDEAGLELQAREPGRLGDRALELAGAHRPEQHLVLGDGERELAVRAEPAVDVGAYSDRDGAAQPQQRVDVRVSALRVVAQREQLLELVDDEEPVRRRPRRRETGAAPGVRSEACRSPSISPSAHGGDDAGAQHRGLAAARGADDGEQSAGRKPPDERSP